MSEPAFTLEAQELQLRKETAAEALCDAGQHKPHFLWDWRCERCQCLLCSRCTEEVDRCCCRKEARHG